MNRLLPALLLIACFAPAALGQGFTTMNICNAGTVSVDAYVMLEGKLTQKSIGPADCEQMFQVSGGISPAGIGFAFTDAKGVWGAAKRLDLFPVDTMGPYNRTISVKHGTATVSMPLKAQWAPDPPTCTQTTSSSARANLPLNATTSQRIQAEQADQQAASNAGPICYSVGLGLTVIPYADSHELGFDTQCDPCEAKQYANMTPEERESKKRQLQAYEQTIHNLTFLPGAGGALGRAMANLNNQAEDQLEQEANDRAEIAKGPWKMDWQKLSSFIVGSFEMGKSKPTIANRHIVIQGTVSKVVLPKAGAERPWINVYFKEAHEMTTPVADLPGDYGLIQVIRGPNPESAFDICTLGPDIFQELFGANYATAMVGKTLQIEGEMNRGWCEASASVRIALARQLKAVAAGTPINARLWDTAMAPKMPDRGVVTPPKEHVYDAREPNYSLTSDRAIGLARNYCAQLYNGGTAVGRRTESVGTADYNNCVAKFDGMELANHRRAAMRYCFTNFNYFLPGGDVNAKIKQYDSCMYKNDTLTALCMMAATKASNRACDAPRPTDIERAVIRDGGFDEKDKAMVIPPNGPGLPQAVTAFEPNAALPASAATRPTATPATPAPAPARAANTATATPAPAAAPAAPARVGPDLLIESVVQLLKAKTPEARIMQVVQADGKPHPLTGADRARLEDAGASENLMDAIEHPKPAAAPASTAARAQADRIDQRQKALACQDQAKRDHPNDPAAQSKAIMACVQGTRPRQ